MEQAKMKKGFTLAEVLITLGVIGIVAAMTIPNLVSNYQKKVFATKAKQTYSILSNALALSEIDNGAPDGWFIGEVSDSYSGGTQETLTHIVETYFKPYFKVAEDLGYADGHYSIVLNNGMTLTFTTDSTIVKYGSSVKYRPTSIYVIASNNKNTKRQDDSSRDYSKHDLFFKISRLNNKFFPFAWSNSQTNQHDYTTIKNREELIDHVKYGCSKTIAKNKRFNCGALIMFDGWEIKDDYPW